MPFSGRVFHALSHGAIDFAQSVGFETQLNKSWIGCKRIFTSLKVVSGANTQNKTDHTNWEGMKYCERKQGQNLWTFLFTATCAFGKVWYGFILAKGWWNGHWGGQIKKLSLEWSKSGKYEYWLIPDSQLAPAASVRCLCGTTWRLTKALWIWHCGSGWLGPACCAKICECSRGGRCVWNWRDFFIAQDKQASNMS